jgi:hypothetical protein
MRHCRHCYNDDPIKCEARRQNIKPDELPTYEACACRCHDDREEDRDDAGGED